MDIKKLENEIKEAKERLWDLMVQGEDGEKAENISAYIRYLEEEIKGVIK